MEGLRCLLREATCCLQAVRRDRQAGLILSGTVGSAWLRQVPHWQCGFGEVAVLVVLRAGGPGKVGAGQSYGRSEIARDM